MKKRGSKKREPGTRRRVDKAMRKRNRTVAQAGAALMSAALGEQIKRHRLEVRMLTQQEAAAEIGIASTSLRAAEKGKMGLLVKRQIVRWMNLMAPPEQPAAETQNLKD